MRKSDKKRDNQIRQTLTQICDEECKLFEGFLWLTHVVNYDRFPSSLKLVCVFDRQSHLTRFLQSSQSDLLIILIVAQLAKMTIKIKPNQIVFDCEETCELQHQGNWARRLTQ